MTLQFIRQHLMILVLFGLSILIGGCGATSVPPAPTGLTISSTVSENILTWNSVSGCNYNIYRGTTSGTESLYEIGNIQTTFIDTPSVSSSTPYYYYVTAVNADGIESAPSNEVSVTPPVLSLGTVTSTSVALAWTMPASATSYNIYRSTSSDTEGLPVLASSAAALYTDTTVVPGSAYYYRVTAIGLNGESLGSNEVQANIPTP